MSKKLALLSVLVLGIFICGCENKENSEKDVNNDSYEVELGFDASDSESTISDIPTTQEIDDENIITQGRRDVGSIDVNNASEEL